MSRKVEEYIKTNKKDFDIKKPSEDLWKKIEAELDKKKERKPLRLPSWIGIAAMIVLITTVCLIYIYPERNDSVEVAELNPQLAKKEMRFASLIEEKKDSLEVYAKDNPSLYNKFNSDLEKLTADYEELKKELPQSPNQRLVVKAMVKNLELQLQVINQQLQIINQVNEYKRENQI